MRGREVTAAIASLSSQKQEEFSDILFDELNKAITEEANSEILAILRGEKEAPVETPLPNPGMFRISHYGGRHYGVRGYGTLARSFYRTGWPKIAPHVESEIDEMFWHNFTLKPGMHHILDPWKQYIYEDLDEEYR